MEVNNNTANQEKTNSGSDGTPVFSGTGAQCINIYGQVNTFIASAPNLKCINGILKGDAIDDDEAGAGDAAPEVSTGDADGMMQYIRDDKRRAYYVDALKHATSMPDCCRTTINEIYCVELGCYTDEQRNKIVLSGPFLRAVSALMMNCDKPVNTKNLRESVRLYVVQKKKE